jgi:hypothetical protein
VHPLSAESQSLRYFAQDEFLQQRLKNGINTHNIINREERKGNKKNKYDCGGKKYITHPFFPSPRERDLRQEGKYIAASEKQARLTDGQANQGQKPKSRDPDEATVREKNQHRRQTQRHRNEQRDDTLTANHENEETRESKQAQTADSPPDGRASGQGN